MSDIPASAPAPTSSSRIRMRGRSFLALVLVPEPDLVEWLTALDTQMLRSVGFFAGKPVILDLSLLSPETPYLDGLYQALVDRDIRILSIEGADPSWPAFSNWEWPQALDGGRPVEQIDIMEDETSSAEPPPPAPRTLLIDNPVRSGQAIVHPEGDVIVIGSVASGAEISAGGSIHVYGQLRGRAIAGVGGHPEARIFATSLQAELLALDGYYMTADEINPALLGKPAQALLMQESIIILPFGGTTPLRSR